MLKWKKLFFEEKLYLFFFFLSWFLKSLNGTFLSSLPLMKNALRILFQSKLSKLDISMHTCIIDKLVAKVEYYKKIIKTICF